MALIRVPGQPFVIATESGDPGLSVADAGVSIPAGIYPLGVPINDDARGSQIEFVAGVIRQVEATPAQWYFISDSGHYPIGWDTEYGDAAAKPPSGNLHASGGSLFVRFGKTYNRVLAVQVTPDETLANDYGLVCGASVGVDMITIRGRISRQIAGSVRYDGSAWAAVPGSYQGTTPTTSYNPTNGALTVTHASDFCRGAGLALTSWFQNSQVPYRAVARSVGHGSFDVNFVDDAGAIVTGAASQRMAFIYNKNMNIPVRFDGADGHAIPGFHTGGNIWICGVMEVAAP